MERLTEKHYGANDYYMTCSEECERDNCVECAAFEKIVDRLGTYEDTGLTPEEVLLKDKADEIALELRRFADLKGLRGYTSLRELAEDDVMECAEKLPAADVAPVVRCRDCEHMEEMIGGTICTFGVCVDCVVPEEFYCAYGRRKDGGAREREERSR